MNSPQTRPSTAPSSKKIDFEVEYVPRKRSDLTFVLKPIQKSNAEAAIKFISDEFIVNEPTGMILGFTWEDYNVYLRFQVEKAVELQIGLIMYNKANEEIVGVFLCEDKYDPSNCEAKSNLISSSYREKMIPFTSHLMKPENLVDFGANPKTRYSSIEFSSAAVSRKYQDCGIAQRMVIFVMFEHPLTSNAEKFMAYSVSAMGNGHAERTGWILLKDIPYADWDVNGTKLFANIEEVQKKCGIPPTKSLQIWGFEKIRIHPRPAL